MAEVLSGWYVVATLFVKCPMGKSVLLWVERHHELVERGYKGSYASMRDHLVRRLFLRSVLQPPFCWGIANEFRFTLQYPAGDLWACTFLARHRFQFQFFSRYSSASGHHRPRCASVISARAAKRESDFPREAKSAIAVSGMSIWV